MESGSGDARRGRLVDEAEPAGVGDSLSTAARPELGVNVADVFLHGVKADHELLGNVTVAPTVGQ